MVTQGGCSSSIEIEAVPFLFIQNHPSSVFKYDRLLTKSYLSHLGAEREVELGGQLDVTHTVVQHLLGELRPVVKLYLGVLESLPPSFERMAASNRWVVKLAQDKSIHATRRGNRSTAKTIENRNIETKKVMTDVNPLWVFIRKRLKRIIHPLSVETP